MAVNSKAVAVELGLMLSTACTAPTICAHTRARVHRPGGNLTSKRLHSPDTGRASGRDHFAHDRPRVSVTLTRDTDSRTLDLCPRRATSRCLFQGCLSTRSRGTRKLPFERVFLKASCLDNQIYIPSLSR